MATAKTLSAIRYGYGLSANSQIAGADALLASLQGPDLMAEKYPVWSTGKSARFARDYQKARRAANAKGEQPKRGKGTDRNKLVQISALGLLHGTARILDTNTAFRERLVWFWADHFTAVPKNPIMRAAAPAYIDEAIRPHIGGKFSEILKAVVMHPFMLAYLDQNISVGPNSQVGQRRDRGLNENLAREVLELHSLGVGSSYAQNDVRQLAELFTGLTITKNFDFNFSRRIAEPGTKTVLGKPYGGAQPSLQHILDALDDIALHRDTAAHISRKLAVNLVADRPDQNMVNAMTRAYLQTGGDLMAVYRAMLEHPAAWSELGQKAKKPFDFLASAFLALGLTGEEIIDLDLRTLKKLVAEPLVLMGQPFMQASGPDGWPEAAEEWITPLGIAARIAWADAVAQRVGTRIRSPQDLMERALADAASPALKTAVSRAASRKDAVTLVFASAEFNRR